ncbi:MAG: gas vesicle synthesis GvpLGvpF [Candidatus Infernicultor aquiphilus]|uniref:Gas vesicle synthesis GvpLGvpF n=1 Tax=Candidatus Infernicultor aquiphilus TaxID=1805029 RepID=A0A2M7K6S5_9BACT|nr:GvpL/GvpF family gas vesicle protein [bacterium]PIW11539.1 MAG: gas vesicle synthesis GvpLGvpF [Candidatus Atribacteria bacterium CG17_big_fil_post_rev_8_21_14_2_50_34_11]PIX33837.1 MAG: gas vesicle synthesis GvpLGvpF [Candidatus Atribacteria bacterium CG_4_8_14_3_um_filter_34_18]PIY33419.1 MAG: gas vesicle synthesis GvpLGvpF [Candidatus Atribacteria bacterium CG_4_10_14_3_um_filter_34_13]PJB55907.1 MAG: gas vesicle synthesis GvpLGvpF [Candidatus Atribacteria bacterium CG_4_9_14_3_um_filter_
MEKEGKYIYCIIGTKQERNFGPLGIGGRGDEVLTIGYDDLSMVVSSYPMTKFIVSRENMLAHMRVIEKVMNEFDSVLPVRFGTVASNADEIRNLLDRRLREFRSLLRNMDHKVELGVKGLWKNMKVIFEEIVEENREIKKAKEKIQNEVGKKNIPSKTEVGKMVEEALKKKKEREAEKIVDALRRTAFEYKLNKIIGDEMFMNAAFLVDKGREKEFDNIIEDLSERYRDRVKFVYVGPVPVYSFVNIVIYPEEWEK